MGAKNGFGKTFTAIGSIYEGPYLKSKRTTKSNETGKLTARDGRIYVGPWKNGMMQGFATQTLRNGNIYKGPFKDSLKHGRGRYTIKTSGLVVIGEWRKNRQVPDGANDTYILPDGRTFSRVNFGVDQDALLQSYKAEMTLNGGVSTKDCFTIFMKLTKFTAILQKENKQDPTKPFCYPLNIPKLANIPRGSKNGLYIDQSLL